MMNPLLQIEVNGLGILPRDGEREGLKTGSAQRSRAVGQEPCAESATPAILPADADLRHVAYVFPHAGAEQQGGNFFAIAVSEHARRGSVEESTPREADNVVQKSQRAGDGAVLVVDERLSWYINLRKRARISLLAAAKSLVSPKAAQFQPIQDAVGRPFQQGGRNSVRAP